MSTEVTSYIDSKYCFIITIIGVIGGLVVGLYLGMGLERKCNLENKAKINDITKQNDSVKIEIKHIDSLKNEEIIQVKGLNNDSTYKLFKQLVSE